MLFFRQPGLLGTRTVPKRTRPFGADQLKIRAVFPFVQAADQVLNLLLIDKSHS